MRRELMTKMAIDAAGCGALIGGMVGTAIGGAPLGAVGSAAGVVYGAGASILTNPHGCPQGHESMVHIDILQ